MAQQEIGIKLKADTRDAIKSVKELERAAEGLSKIDQKGQKDNGFISEDDVKQFKRLSNEADSIYKNFMTNFNRMNREFEKKKAELENSLKANVDKAQSEEIRKEISRLEAQRTLLNTQRSAAENMNTRMNSATENVNGMRTDNNMTMFMGGMGKNALGLIAGSLAFGSMFGMGRQGMQMVKSEEEYMAMLGNRMGGYNGDYQKAREDAMNTGMSNGYKAMETMQLTDQYTRLAGTRGAEQTWDDVQSIQTSARAMGVDPNVLASSGGMQARFGAVQDGEQRKFANLLAGAIKKEGMQGRDQELIDAVDSMSATMATSQVSLSKGELQQMVGLQAMLGSKEEAWKGQRGADILNSVDQGIKGGDNRVDMLLGWGSEFQGTSGRADLERMKAKGITDPENVKRIFSNIDTIAGGDKDYQALMVSEMFGISIDQADRLLEDDIMSELKKGGMSKKELDAMIKSGESGIDSKSKEYQGSEAARRSKVDSKWEETKKWGGEIMDSVFYPVADWFTGLDPAAQWGAMGAGAAGTMALGSKALSKGKQWFGSKFGKKVGEEGAEKAAKGGLKGLGALGKKFIGPIGTVMTMDMIDKGIQGGFDWAFGHEEGDIKPRGLFDMPFKSTGTYEDSKQGALMPKKAKAAEIEEQENNKKSNLQLEKQNLDKKTSLIEKEKTLKEEEKKNIEQLEGIFGSNSKVSGGEEKKSIWERLFGGIFPGFFGTNTSSGGGGNNYVAGGGNTSQYQNMSLKGGDGGLTAKQINSWIDSKAPKGSIMRGKGDTFLKAAQESGLDVRYLVAHAAHETGWGTSNISKKKGNMYGIGAFDASPYSSAYGYNNTDAGIIEGAKWIANNYVNKGQDTLQEMRHNGGSHEYATDPLWDEKIAGIMKGAPTATLNVNVAGSIDGLTPENNGLVTNALVNSLGNSPNLMYEFQQGVGGRQA
jgi:hypothetical protein